MMFIPDDTIIRSISDILIYMHLMIRYSHDTLQLGLPELLTDPVIFRLKN